MKADLSTIIKSSSFITTAYLDYQKRTFRLNSSVFSNNDILITDGFSFSLTNLTNSQITLNNFSITMYFS
jgi:hypothetical protein